MFSMAGVPPAVGFYAKLSVLWAVVDAGFVWLAVIAVLFSLIGAFYYLRIVKLMYFDPPADAVAAGALARHELAVERQWNRHTGSWACSRANSCNCAITPSRCRCSSWPVVADEAHPDFTERQLTSKLVYDGRHAQGARRQRAAAGRRHRAPRMGAASGSGHHYSAARRAYRDHGAPVPLPAGPPFPRTSGRQDRAGRGAAGDRATRTQSRSAATPRDRGGIWRRCTRASATRTSVSSSISRATSRTWGARSTTANFSKCVPMALADVRQSVRDGRITDVKVVAGLAWLEWLRD